MDLMWSKQNNFTASSTLLSNKYFMTTKALDWRVTSRIDRPD